MPPASKPSRPRLMILDPGHFHAALIQKEMYGEVDPQVSVYAPLAPELLDYLSRVSLFNNREENATGWLLDIHTGPDPLARMLHDRKGNVAVLAGRNRPKMERISAAIAAGFHVLADKPWIISSADLGKLEDTLAEAQRNGLVAYDIMTERYEVTSELVRELVNTPALFGRLEPGAETDPGIFARSVHSVMKIVSGLPLRRPPWFFDIEEYGEGLADVGTHVVDLVQWTAFADQAIDCSRDINMLSARRWPLTLSGAQLSAVTGEAGGRSNLDYFCNNSVAYRFRGVHVELEISWEWQAEPGRGDIYEARFRGTQSKVEIRQGEPENHQPEVYVTPSQANRRAAVFGALASKVRALQARWPGLSLFESGDAARLFIPERFRVGHEAHFAQAAHRFFEYFERPEALPAWENPNMLAKYYVSTKGVELSRA